MNELYTASADYFATGEGTTRMILVMYASNEKEVTEAFLDHFGSHGRFLLPGLQIEKGIKNKHYLPEAVQHALKSFETRHPGNFFWFGCLHINYS